MNKNALDLPEETRDQMLQKIEALANQIKIDYDEEHQSYSHPSSEVKRIILLCEKLKKSNKNKPKGFIAVMKHTGTSDGSMYFRKTYEEAVDEVHDHFLSYDFEVRDGKAYDPGHEGDDPNEPFNCFNNVEFYNGKVSQFWHCHGDGPEGWVQENE